MYLRGSDHWTVDLDLTVEANMEQILTILREEPRYYLSPTKEEEEMLN